MVIVGLLVLFKAVRVVRLGKVSGEIGKLTAGGDSPKDQDYDPRGEDA
jgi:hypothetical protein